MRRRASAMRRRFLRRSTASEPPMSDDALKRLYGPGDAVDPERVIDPVDSLEDEVYGASLRPRSFDEYVGQTTVVDNLKIAIEAAKQRKEPLEHVLFYGPPGLG